MPIIKKGLFTVWEKFPDDKDKVKRLFRESETFQAVCEDYMRCAEALRYWNQSDSEEAPARREEYTALLKDLEGEILQSLNESK